MQIAATPAKVFAEIKQSRLQKSGNLAIVDSLYENQEKKTDFSLKQRRLKIKGGRLKGPTIVQERTEHIEKQVTRDHHL